MFQRQALSGQWAFLWILIAIAMWGTTLLTGTQSLISADTGLCLPSPDQWIISTQWSIAANLGVLALTVIVLYIADKEYTLVQGSNTFLPAILALMASSCRWIAAPLSSSTLIALANVIALTILFGCYRKQNCTQALFLIATILAIGSMVQYAFLFLIPVYLIGAIIFKCLDFKGIIAFIMGLAAPYWIAIGLGLIPLAAFKLPRISIPEGNALTHLQFLTGIVPVGVTVLAALLLGLHNMVGFFSGNTRRRLNNTVISLLGIVCAICAVIDLNNMQAYLTTLYLVGALQIANWFVMSRPYRPGIWAMVITLFYAIAYGAMTWAAF